MICSDFTYEKYFSGKYLGDLTRLIFVSSLREIGESVADSWDVATADVSAVIKYCYTIT